MYADPAHIRSKRVNLSLNDTEMRVVEAMAEFHGVQPFVFMRELAMSALREMHGSKSESAPAEMRHANAQLRRNSLVQNHETTFSGNDLAALEAEAQSRGVPLDAFASRLVSDELKRRYQCKDISAAPVLPFKRRRTDVGNFPVTEK